MAIKRFLSPGLLLVAAGLAAPATAALCQQAAPIVQPGAPGMPSTTISPEDAKNIPVTHPPTAADISFMQGMIMHHGQAIEMTALLARQGADPKLKQLGERITLSQSFEMGFMKNWLQQRGQPISGPMDMDMGDMAGMDMDDMAPMPGMLTPKQMAALKAANGKAFDVLFLKGMIQHHSGALSMVKDLLATQGAAQDPKLSEFVSDVDNTQQAEIDIMKRMLKEKQ